MDNQELVPGQLFESAIEAWWEGNAPLAFHYCQAALARGLATPDLYRLLGAIASEFGQYDQAISCLTEAKRLRGFTPSSTAPRYLVIQPWGCGFWGEVDHALAQFAIAEITGRQPIVYWGDDCIYAYPGLINAWEGYFRPVSDVVFADVRKPGLSYFPKRWNVNNLHLTSAGRNLPPKQRLSSLVALDADENVVVADCHNRLLDILPWAPFDHWLAKLSAEAAYRELARKYLRLTEALENEIDRLCALIFQRRPVMAVHYRTQSREKDQESAEGIHLSVKDYFPQIDQFLLEHPQGSIFLLTDFMPAVQAMLQRYAPRVFTLSTHRLDREEDIEVTFQPLDRSVLAREVIIDVYIAARCDFFLGDGASGVSCSVGHLKEWPTGSFRLLRENVVLMPGRVQPF